MKKLLLQRFPNSTAEELNRAHGYAYGGCVIQDMGYYPFNSRFFSDLTHYVRSGDFVVALIRESKDLNEFAFALGALEHYVADTEGHRIATNRAVPLLYPDLRRKFGREVTYWDNPVAHIQTEFGFDVVQVALGRYAPDNYHGFIGFEVSRELLERAFFDTYDIEMKDVFGNMPLALGTYRWAVRSLVPKMTRVAWNIKRDNLRKETPGITRKKFLYNLSRASYEKDWGKEYYRPGIGVRILTALLSLLPGKGPLSALRIRTPTPEVEKLFMESFNATVASYKEKLAETAGNRTPRLPNENFDGHIAVVAGSYKGSDEAYAKLLETLAKRDFQGVNSDLRDNILAYYKNGRTTPPSAKLSSKQVTESRKVAENLDRLKAIKSGSGS